MSWVYAGMDDAAEKRMSKGYECKDGYFCQKSLQAARLMSPGKPAGAPAFLKVFGEAGRRGFFGSRLDASPLSDIHEVAMLLPNQKESAWKNNP